MSGEHYTDTASTAALSAPCGSGDLTITVSGVSSWPAAPCWARIAGGTASMEIVRVTNIAGSTFTVSRGQSGTGASAHGAGDTVEHVAPSDFFNAATTHIAATSNVHGLAVGSSVVGTNDAQTLANKTYRGAHRALYSDALPAGITASYESLADSNAARDGFVHRNTAGDAARKAFLLEQSGTERWSVSNTGKMTVAPTSGVGIENDGTLQQDGAATFANNVTVSGSVTVGSGIGVGGTAVVAGNATFSADATVNGVVRPKEVVFQPAGVATTPRLDLRTNLTTDALRVRDDAGVLQYTVTGGGAVNALGDVNTLGRMGAATGFFAHGSAMPCIPVVASLPGSAVTDEVVFRTSDKRFYRWTGAAWVDLSGPLGVIARGNRPTASSVSTSTSDVAVLRVDNVPLKSGRLYRVVTSPLALDSTSTGDEIGARVRVDTAGLATVTSTIVPGTNVVMRQVDQFTPEHRVINATYKPSGDVTASFLLCVRRHGGTGNATIQSDTTTAGDTIDLVVEDLGVDPTDTGVDL